MAHRREKLVLGAVRQLGVLQRALLRGCRLLGRAIALPARDDRVRDLEAARQDSLDDATRVEERCVYERVIGVFERAVRAGRQARAHFAPFVRHRAQVHAIELAPELLVPDLGIASTTGSPTMLSDFPHAFRHAALTSSMT